MGKNCLICNTEMIRRSCDSKSYWENKKYCGMKCYGKSKQGHSYNKGRVHTKEQNEAHSKVMKGRNSGELSYLWKGGRITKECKTCNSEFTALKSHVVRAKYCSRNCAAQGRNFGKSSASDKIRRSRAYKDWRSEVYKRDNYTCQSCGVRGGSLHADHIKPFALFPELRLNVDNGRTLCEDCHRKTDTYGRRALNYKAA